MNEKNEFSLSAFEPKVTELEEKISDLQKNPEEIFSYHPHNLPPSLSPFEKLNTFCEELLTGKPMGEIIVNMGLSNLPYIKLVDFVAELGAISQKGNFVKQTMQIAQKQIKDGKSRQEINDSFDAARIWAMLEAIHFLYKETKSATVNLINFSIENSPILNSKHPLTQTLIQIYRDRRSLQNTLLFNAAKSGDLTGVENALKRGAEINAKDWYDHSAVQHAAEGGQAGRNDFRAFIHLGCHYANANKKEEAERSYEQAYALASSHEKWIARYWQGHGWAILNNSQHAITYYEDSLRLNKDHHHTYDRLAELYRRPENNNQALAEALKKISDNLQAGRNDFRAFIHLGCHYANANKKEEAERSYEQACALASSHEKWIARYWQGHGWAILNNSQHAITYYEDSLRLNKDHHHTYDRLAELYRRPENNNQALAEALKKISDNLQAGRNDFRAFIHLGHQYANSRKPGGVERCYQQAYTMASNNEKWIALYWQGHAFAILGMYQHAIASYENSLGLNKNHHHTYDRLTEIYTQLGNHQMATNYSTVSTRIQQTGKADITSTATQPNSEQPKQRKLTVRKPDKVRAPTNQTISRQNVAITPCANPFFNKSNQNSFKQIETSLKESAARVNQKPQWQIEKEERDRQTQKREEDNKRNIERMKTTARILGHTSIGNSGGNLRTSNASSKLECVSLRIGAQGIFGGSDRFCREAGSNSGFTYQNPNTGKIW